MLKRGTAFGTHIGLPDFELGMVGIVVEFPEHPVSSVLSRVIRWFIWFCHDRLTPEMGSEHGLCLPYRLVRKWGRGQRTSRVVKKSSILKYQHLSVPITVLLCQGYRTKNCWTLCQGFDIEGWVNLF